MRALEMAVAIIPALRMCTDPVIVQAIKEADAMSFQDCMEYLTKYGKDLYNDPRVDENAGPAEAKIAIAANRIGVSNAHNLMCGAFRQESEEDMNEFFRQLDRCRSFILDDSSVETAADMSQKTAKIAAYTLGQVMATVPHQKYKDAGYLGSALYFAPLGILHTAGCAANILSRDDFLESLVAGKHSQGSDSISQILSAMKKNDREGRYGA